VISGEHTKSGKPILSSDPHLGTGNPSFWQIQHLHYKALVDGKNETRYMVGSSSPGIPLVLIGRTRHISWGITAAVTDVSDLFREKISDDGLHYEVDGEQRDLIIDSQIIKVKDAEPVEFDLKHTHRGPLMPTSIIRNAQVLFGSKLPVYDGGNYTLSWAGRYPGESLFNALDHFHAKSLPELAAR